MSALHAWVRETRIRPIESAKAHGLLRTACENAVEDLVMAAAIDPPRASLLDRALEFRLQQGTERVLHSLGIAFADEPIELIIEGIDSNKRHTRSNAIELLGTLLDSPHRSTVLALFDDVSWAERLEQTNKSEAIRDHVALLPRRDRKSWLQLLGEEDGSWMSICALDALNGSHSPSMTQISQLMALPPFEDVEGGSLNSLVGIASDVEVAEGVELIREGPEGERVYLVMRGTFGVRVGDRVLPSLGPGDVVGEVSVLDDDLDAATVVATTSSRVLRMERDAFYEMITSHPDVGQAVIHSLTRRLRKTIEESRSR